MLFDGGGVAAQAYRLYKAAFDRVPDSAGLGYWITDQPGHDYWAGILDGGASVGDVLASFSESPENQAALATVIGNGFAYTPYGA